jgi:isoleucyl-tRNA synthetase
VSNDAEPSIHLRPYPEVDESRVDHELTDRIDVIVRYKNLGLALRNQANLKVRQPLARLLVKPVDSERQAFEQPGLEAQLLEELNIKALELVDSVEHLVRTEVKPDFKALGPRYGSLMKQIQKELAGVDVAALQSTLDKGSRYALMVGETEVLLGPEDVQIRHSAPEGLAFTVQDDRFVAIDTEITPELKREGQVRDLVRGIQEERKRVDLDVADRIRLRYQAPQEIADAVAEWSEYISRETLAVEIEPDGSLADNGTMLKVAGMAVHISVEKVEAA